jgi:hypothetical protein
MTHSICSFVTTRTNLISTKFQTCTLSSAQLASASDFNALDQPLKTYEAVPPDTATLVGFAVVSLLSIIAYFVWANEVVPVSRTKLALSKRDGEVKAYLDELRAVNTTETIDDEGDVRISINANDGRNFERWLFSDWLNNNKSAKGGRKKPSALPILKNAKWNSGDNPVLVTTAMLMVGVLIAAITERIGN